MYVSEGRPPVRASGPLALLRERTRVSRNVWWLGATSLATDVSSEMITAILPLYLVAYHGVSPLAFGAIDGLHQGLSSIVRWVAGYAGDRSGRHKEVAGLGYALSAVTRLGWLAAAPSASTVAALIGIDRIGKGLRTAPRDALISLSVPHATLGYAFGVHRAMDAAGVMIGPLAAFAILSAAPDRFDRVFSVSLAAAFVGVAVLALGVRNPRPEPGAPQATAPLGLRESFAVLRDPPFRRIVVVAMALSFMSVSDAFLYLALRDRAVVDNGTFPLLFAATGVSFLLWAAPMGLLADRVGRRAVFLLGHLALLVAYGSAIWSPPGFLWLTPVVLGGYYAATDGVLQAMAGARLAVPVMGSGLALVGTATSVGRLAASVAVGALWTVAGPRHTLLGFAMGLMLVLAASTWLTADSPESPA